MNVIGIIDLIAFAISSALMFVGLFTIGSLALLFVVGYWKR